MRKATECKVCKSKELHHGAYCKPCWRRQEYIYRHGSADGYDPTPPCTTPGNCERCAKEFGELCQRHPNYRRLCHQCGVDKHRELQQSIRAKQQHKPGKPIVASPKRHRAVGQAIPPPAPKAQPKPVPMTGPIPKGMTGRLPSSCPNLRQYCATETNPYWPSAKR